MAVIEAVRADSAAAVKERLEEFGREVLAEAMNRPAQMENGGLYLRGLIEEGKRKSLEPMVERLGGEADYQSMQQFLTDSPWDPAEVVRAVAERVAPEIEILAWVLDDTGFPKQGKRSPGVKRQYSGTLGKIGNCQIGVSVHAVGERGTVPLGWALYLPEEWCEDAERRAQAKIPEEVCSRRSPSSGSSCSSAPRAGRSRRRPCWATAPTARTTSCASACTTPSFSTCSRSPRRRRVRARDEVPVPERKGASGRPRGRLRPDRKPEAIAELIAGLDRKDWQTVAFRDGPDGEPMTSRFAFVRVRAAHHWQWGFATEPREEWLICEWPEGEEEPTDYWLSNLPRDEEPERLARLARLRWKIELDYKQLKGELGLDHYEGRSYLGWHHHTALVTAAHGFLTLERLHPFRPPPA